MSSASDLGVVRAVGVESERELAFAALHQLCVPILDRLERLPGPQRDALRVTFGLREGPVPDRFLVGLALLGLLAEAAQERALVCAVDDAQWLDAASARALAFVARRLLAESVLLLFAARQPSDELLGLPELAAGGPGPGGRVGWGAEWVAGHGWAGGGCGRWRGVRGGCWGRRFRCCGRGVSRALGSWGFRGWRSGDPRRPVPARFRDDLLPDPL